MRLLTRHRKPRQEYGIALHILFLHCRAESVPSSRRKCWKVQGRGAGCAFPLPEPMLSARRLSQPLWHTAQRNQQRQNFIFKGTNILLIILILCFSFPHANKANWADFWHYGDAGVFGAAAIVFFAYNGARLSYGTVAHV